jgi:pimeloyl-ACP methyl ester carboxylesterase
MATVRNGDVTINVREAGSGAPVMLVHGLGLRADVWINQFDAFAEHYHVIAPDLRGAGASSHPTARGSYEIDRFVDDLVAVARDLAGGPLHFVGTSSGGFIGQVMALRVPEMLKSLVLCHSTSFTRVPPKVMETRVKILKSGSMEDYSHLVAAQALATHQRPAVLDWFREMIEQNDRDIYAQIFIESMKSFDLRKRVGEIHVPTLVLIGEHDRVVPAALGRETAKLIPGARKAVMRGVGHCGYIEQPLEFNHLVMTFIDSVERGGGKGAATPARPPSARPVLAKPARARSRARH